jgi:tetratricopeptide (TPR) repeat protein
MRGFLVGAMFVSVSAIASVSLAQDAPAAPAAPEKPAEKTEKAAPAPEKKKAEAAADGGEIRRDPRGIKGISPFWEALLKGDKAYIARDFDSAITAYQEAIKLEPQNALGHYRMGEAQLAKGNQAEAEQSWTAGLRFVADNHKLKAKLLFVIADLRERQKNYDDALARWDDYAKFVTAEQAAKGFAQTPPERKKRIDEWKKNSADSAEVKKRIDARLKEADETARKNAK